MSPTRRKTQNSESLLNVEVMIQCDLLADQAQLDTDRLIQAARKIASDYDVKSGEVSLAIVDDAFIRNVNRQFLNHDWPTDVISFCLSDSDEDFSAELVISLETADRMANELPWSTNDECLLYTIHGMLHVVGFDDQTEEDAREMREIERNYLILWQVPQASDHGSRVWVHNDANDACANSESEE